MKLGAAPDSSPGMTFEGVMMGWDEVPVVPPTLTMGCGDIFVIDPVGASRTPR